MTTPSNTDDIINSRDVIARIEELEGERDTFEPQAVTTADLSDPALAVEDRPAQTWAEENPDDAAELKALQDLANDAEGYAADWRHGETLIRDSYFEDYARELAEDLHGNAMRETSWPFSCIDWERAARELQMDYTSVKFDGVTYWVR